MTGPVRRVLVVDDRAVFRDAVRQVFADDGHFIVVAEAASRSETTAVMRSDQSIDIALVDVNLGDEDGIDVARNIARRHPDIAVVLISTMSRDDLPSDHCEAGVCGFISKMCLTPALLGAVVDAR